MAAWAAKDRSQKRYEAATAHYEMMNNGSRVEDVAEATAEVARTKAKSALLENGTREEDITLAEATVAEIKGRLAEVEVNRKEAVVWPFPPRNRRCAGRPHGRSGAAESARASRLAGR